MHLGYASKTVTPFS